MSPLAARDVVERALRSARCDECVVIADETSSANLRWAGNTLTTNGVSRTRQLTVVAISRGRGGPTAGVVSRAGVRDDQIEAVVREAEQAAAEGSPAEDAMPLVTPGAAGAVTAGQDAPGWDDPVDGTGISVFSAFAPALGEAFSRAAAGGRRLYGFAEHVVTSTFLGTSAGLRLRHDQPTGKVELQARTADMSQSAWDGASTRDFSGIDVAEMEAGLATRLGWAKRRVSRPPGRYETLLPPSAVADLFVYLYWSAGAKDAMDGRTVFSKPGGGTRLGDQLTSLPLTLSSDPGRCRQQCAPFVIAHASSRQSSVFDNGLPLGRTGWISDGRLAALTQTRATAQAAGLPVTPPIGNLAMSVAGADAELDDMIRRTTRGLLLTCLWYIREVDPQTLLLTGLTRDGVYLVENGEVTGAVNNFRFNESPVAVLDRIAEAGGTLDTLPREWSDWWTRAQMPPLRVDGFNMSSVSQAS
ncbi:MAG TPA: metallopeptidase TldD-related protein [Streptosporangiaceae bacterium]|jgi:predicted Zn-dependent protease|nr:metallopeptidase TldD-related protein [Streptosporangiaceae bacterium]